MKFQIGDMVRIDLAISDRCELSQDDVGCIRSFESGIGRAMCCHVDWLVPPFNGTSNLVYDDYIVLYDEAL